MIHIALKVAVQEQMDIAILLADFDEMGMVGAEESAKELIVYFEKETFDEHAIDQYLKEKKVVANRSEVQEQNWNAVWESNFEPVLIDDFCYIKAAFHEAKSAVEHVISITPKMSFGTGHHATTAQVIRMMKAIPLEKANVLDFGTGTGVLAILAAKMKAQRVTAIDYDQWSYENALENCLANQCQQVDVRKGTLTDIEESGFDLILANINRSILLEYMPLMSDKMKIAGKLILSGILEEDLPIIKEALAQSKLTVEQQTIKDKWCCLLVSKKVVN